jgi:dCTP deaminase
MTARTETSGTVDGPAGLTGGGILPSQDLRALIEEGRISAPQPIREDQIQPASLDLRLGSMAYRIRASFLPGAGGTVAERIESFATHGMPLDQGAVLEKGCVYLVELLERVELANDLVGIANPKSSIGRLDVFTRLIVDGAIEFDRIPGEYGGPLYAEISPLAFSIVVREGSRLNQLRLMRDGAPPGAGDIAALQDRLRADMANAAFSRGALTVSVDLTSPGPDGLVGYKARNHAPLIDVDVKGVYEPTEFWEPIQAQPDGGIILDPNDFHILASREAIAVPPALAAEMVPYDTLVGEFRVHYAGFFDPGFGDASLGAAGTRAVLEVRSHEVPFRVEDGQIVGRLVYEPMADVPDKLYGRGIGSNYQRQGLKLSKHFRQPF